MIQKIEDFSDMIIRASVGEIVNLRRARKQRARISATKDSAVKRAKSGRARAEGEAAQRARALEENHLDAHRRETTADHAG